MSKRTWLIGGNSLTFDHVRCFHEKQVCYWYQQNCVFQKDEIVYVLVKEQNRVMFKTIFEEISVRDLNPHEYYRKDYEPKDNCIKLRLLCEYDNDSDLLNIDALKRHGYKDNSLQKHNCRNIQLIEYITNCFNYKDYIGYIEKSPVAFREGLRHYYLTAIYDRSQKARTDFLAKQTKPYRCAVCEMDFESIYGKRGKDFIHVHHLDPLASETDERETRLNKLVMVCPNCHAMLHRGELLMPKDLKKEIEKTKKSKY